MSAPAITAPAILPSARERWLAERRRYITATDVSAICGINPWRTPLDVFLEKRGLLEPQPESVPMRSGRLLQPLVLDLYEEQTNLPVRRYADDELVVSSDIPWAACTPDGEVTTGAQRIVEAKTSRSTQGWGEPGTDDAPDLYVVQVAWQMLVTGREAADIAALFAGRDFAIYHVNRVDALTRTLAERCERFWNEHVLANVAPEIGAGETAAAYLHQQFPRDTRPELLPSDERLDTLAARLAELRTARDNYATEVETVENLIKADIGDAAGVAGARWRATWKAAKDSTSVNWQELAKHALSCEQLAALKKQFTTTKPGSRRFLFTFDND